MDDAINLGFCPDLLGDLFTTKFEMCANSTIFMVGGKLSDDFFAKYDFLYPCGFLQGFAKSGTATFPAATPVGRSERVMVNQT
jgi:hypothetical protein